MTNKETLVKALCALTSEEWNFLWNSHERNVEYLCGDNASEYARNGLG